MQAQQIAPPVNPEPLVRPKYLAIVKSKDPQQLLSAISDSLTRQGFVVGQYDLREGQIEATRPNNNEKKAYDKVVIWIERDIREPEEYLKLYLLYGRYEEIVAEKTESYRVVISTAEEENRIGKLNRSLISLSSGK